MPDLTVKPLDEIYLDVHPDGTKKIRFPGIFLNIGDGPLELVGRHDTKTNTTKVIQNLYGKNETKEEKEVGSFMLHQDHEHWHFEDFVIFELHTLKENRQLDKEIITSGKMTFCIRDSGKIKGSYAGQPKEAAYTHCRQDIQGISVGWYDEYSTTISGQELDITGIEDGTYAFKTIVDPDNRIIEKDEDNNTSISYIEIIKSSIRILEK